MCLAQGHNAVTPVKLKSAAPPFRVKHSTTEPLGSLDVACVGMMVLCLTVTFLRGKCYEFMALHPKMLCSCYEQVQNCEIVIM